MGIKTVVVGVLQVNCYLFYDETSKECLIIDPGDDADKIYKVIENNSLKPAIIVNTHYHFDHTGANRSIKSRHNIPIAIGEKDAPFLKDAYKAALEFMIQAESSPKADILLKEGETLSVGENIFEVLETPGHTQGSICLYSKKEKILFSGDTLFYESVGRWDLPTGDKKMLFASLDRLLNLEKDVAVFPGHGQTTTIEHEVKNNPYKRGML